VSSILLTATFFFIKIGLAAISVNDMKIPVV